MIKMDKPWWCRGSESICFHCKKNGKCSMWKKKEFKDMYNTGQIMECPIDKFEHKTHKHNWQFVKTYKKPGARIAIRGYENDDMAEFVCECGATKHVELDEVD